MTLHYKILTGLPAPEDISLCEMESIGPQKGGTIATHFPWWHCVTEAS